MIRKEDYIPFELAKKLKEVGFPQSFYNGDYAVDDNGEVYTGLSAAMHSEKVYKLATLAEVGNWLRREKNIYIVLLPCIKEISQSDFSKCDYFEYRVVYRGSEPYVGCKDTYEEAFTEAIEKSLELCTK